MRPAQPTTFKWMAEDPVTVTLSVEEVERLRAAVQYMEREREQHRAHVKAWKKS